MRRWPLWTTLLPLVIGLGIYWWYWDRERDAFEASLATMFSERRADVAGFPYRLEATIAEPRLRHDGQYVLDIRADRAVLNRQPWRDRLTFARLADASLQWRAPALGLGADIASRSAQASLRLEGTRIVRLSSVHSTAELRLPFVPTPATAASFEWHFRETPATPDPASRAPTFPEQAQLVLGAEALRFGKGDPLRFAAQIGITSTASVWDLSGWRRGGTLELGRATLTDTTGQVLAVVATSSAGSSGPLRIVGTVDTVCPESVAALFAATAPPAREFRARRPVKLSFDGPPDDLRLQLPPAGLPRRPVRAQEAPCPVLYR